MLLPKAAAAAAAAVSAFLPVLTAAKTFPCTPWAIRSLLPSNASATVIFARPVPHNGTFEVPAGNVAYPTSPTGLRALCAIAVNVSSSASSAYSFGLFLPMEEEWNERFLAVGNGGFAGGINWLDMGAGVGYGFATMSTDTGHNSTGAEGSWALNKESLADWGYRAMHGSVELAKEIIYGYYSKKPLYNYYSGCSTGGRQGLKEVEMYPEDFDGVLAGAPAWWTSHLQTGTVQIGNYNLPNTSAHYIPWQKFEIIEAEVLRQCDAQDGLVDNIISDPDGCNFFSEALLCDNDSTADQAGCLTVPQLETLDKILQDYIDVNQTFVLPHLSLSSESQWIALLGGLGGGVSPLGSEYVRYFLLDEPDWDPSGFDYHIVELADQVQPGNATVRGFDFTPFQARGGKLLQYHGLADGLIPSGMSEYLYRAVLRTLKPRGIELDDFYRLFLIPGMQHCAGTSDKVNAPWYFAGANQAGSLSTGLHGVPEFEDSSHDALLALMEWTESGRAPGQIVATKWSNDTMQDSVARQRPVCPYPSQARYIGHGEPDSAASWQCTAQYSFRTQ